jgi:hypothetical protein
MDNNRLHLFALPENDVQCFALNAPLTKQFLS